MKIIAVDNFDRESISDQLIQTDLTEKEAQVRVSKMNSEAGDYAPWYYKVVSDNYSLYVYSPNL